VYQTSTARAHKDVEWYKKLPAQPSPPEHHEEKPDKITTRLNIKRYASAPAGWQVISSAIYHPCRVPLKDQL
jgi:hypothetical protein